MTPTNLRIVILIFLVMIVVMYLSFHTSTPSLPHEEEWETTDGTAAVSGASNSAKAVDSPSVQPPPNIGGAPPVLGVLNEPKSAAVPDLGDVEPAGVPPPPATDLDPKKEMFNVPNPDNAIVQSNEPLPLPVHLTGQWTDQLHEIEMKLVKQMSGGPLDNQQWFRRYERPFASASEPDDQVIHTQLRKLVGCRKYLSNNVKWTRQDLLRELKYFVSEVYPNRPIKFNELGMRLSHLFGCWFITKQLQPKYIIESGVHMGQSTWVMRQAAPHAQIICLDPKADMKYWDSEALYWVDGVVQKEGYRVAPFKDFAAMDWSFIQNKSDVLILFDDHQNNIKRLKQAYKLGFKNIMFDDNGGPLQGDNYSVKQVCDESGGLALREPDFPSSLVLMCDSFHMNDRFISLEDHRKNREYLFSVLKHYYESPPVLFVPGLMEYTVFGHKPTVDKTSVQYVLPRPSNQLLKWFTEQLIAPPIVQSQEEFDDVGLGRLPHRELYNYVSFGYVELL